MNPDRLQTLVPGTDMAERRRVCACRGRRGQHQAGCPLRGRSLFLWWALGVRGDEAQIDHVVPRASGGLAVNGNLVGSCADCNQRRPRGWKMPARQLAAPVDLTAGRTLAFQWYPKWMGARIEDNKRRKREARARRLDTSFPFGGSAA